MSSEQQITPTSDLRAAAQDYKRDAAQKSKWARVIYVNNDDRPVERPKPYRTSHTQSRNYKKPTDENPKAVLKRDIASANEEYPSLVSDDSSSTSADEDPYSDNGTPAPPLDVGVMYSFDNTKAPSSGSQILNTALAKAIEQYEDKETVRLVRKEYDIVDDGEDTRLSPGKKENGKGRVIALEDAEYEFV